MNLYLVYCLEADSLVDPVPDCTEVVLEELGELVHIDGQVDLQGQQYKLNSKLKGTVVVIPIDSPFKNGHARFRTEPFKLLSDQ